MYGSLRFKAGFREEVDKFIEAAKKHATTLKENKDTIMCDKCNLLLQDSVTWL